MKYQRVALLIHTTLLEKLVSIHEELCHCLLTANDVGI